MNTLIAFVGIFVFIYTDGVQFHVLMPNVIPSHDRIIAYREGDRTGGNWQEDPKILTIDGVKYRYVHVTKENIVFDDAMGGPPQNLGFPIPHLTCCCTPFWDGFKDEYGNPDANPNAKLSAHVYVANGQATQVFIPKTSAALSTQFSVPTDEHVEQGLTIRGTLGTVRTIVLKRGAQVIFGNTLISVLDGTYHGGPDDAHFRAYYKMGKKTDACTAIPSKDPKCAPQPASCPAGASSATRTPTPKTAKAAAPPDAKDRRSQMLLIDVDCSNSQWP